MGVIVEFNGMTGCGKSTLAKEFLQNLENQNIYYEVTEAGAQWNSDLVNYKYISFS